MQILKIKVLPAQMIVILLYLQFKQLNMYRLLPSIKIIDPPNSIINYVVDYIGTNVNPKQYWIMFYFEKLLRTLKEIHSHTINIHFVQFPF